MLGKVLAITSFAAGFTLCFFNIPIITPALSQVTTTITTAIQPVMPHLQNAYTFIKGNPVLTTALVGGGLTFGGIVINYFSKKRMLDMEKQYIEEQRELQTELINATNLNAQKNATIDEAAEHASTLEERLSNMEKLYSQSEDFQSGIDDSKKEFELGFSQIRSELADLYKKLEEVKNLKQEVYVP